MRFLILGSLLALPLSSNAQEINAVQSPIVFFDVAGPGSAGLSEFYAKLFGWIPGPDGNLRIDIQSPLYGTFRVENIPETLIYIGVESVTAKLDEVTESGGTVDFPRLEVPGVVILGMFRDPAGNRVGLVEIDSESVAVVPPIPANP